MKVDRRDPPWHLKDPRTRKWMVQCNACRRWGYRHGAPAKFFGQVHMEKYFEELKLDERGLSERCRDALLGPKS
jgi:hypothetical protein